MEIIDPQPLRIPCLEAVQPIGTLYVGIINCDDLETICHADVRRMEIGEHENRLVEDYIGIQRELNKQREKELGRYVNLVDATFPNSIILAMSSEDAVYDPVEKVLIIKYKDDVAKVLDGQHRIAGFKAYNRPANTFQCVVSIFIDMELEDQAIVFATINKEQKNVSNSLVADLFAFAESRSPQKTGHNIARALNAMETSPFHDKIKILGKADDINKETNTQDTFVKNIIRYISADPQQDRDFYKRNKGKSQGLPLVAGKDLNKYIFRNLFIEDKDDIKITQIIFNYFYAVSKRWPQSWNEIAKNNILNRSAGFIALMRLLRDIYVSFNRPGDIISKDEFLSVFNSIQITDGSFTSDVYLPGSTGQGKLYQDLKAYL